MRVAFCGASGTGKTTLARFILQRYGLELCPIGSRQIAAEMGFASPYDVDKAGRRAEFQRRLLDAKTAWEAECEAFVTDRTTLDNLAYSALHCAHEIDAYHYAVSMDAMRRYEIVFFASVHTFCDPGDDPARVKDPTYHRLFDATLRGLLDHARTLVSTKIVELPAGLDARKEAITTALG